MARWFVVFLLAGCGPGVLEVVGAKDGEVDPTDTPTTDAPSDVETDDPGEDTDQGPRGPFSWAGTRHFEFQNGCDGTVQETGEELTDDPSAAEQVAACPQCDAVFRLEVSPGSLCNVPITSPTWRGLTRVGDDLKIFVIAQGGPGGNWGADTLAVAQPSGQDYRYDYDGGWYDVQGSFSLE